MMNNIEYPNKSKWQEIKEAWNDPVKKKVRAKKLFIAVGSLLRGFILIGLCFVILLPIFEKLSAALRHPTDISNSQVVFIPAQFSIINFQVAAEMLTYTESLLNSAVLSPLFVLYFIMYFQFLQGTFDSAVKVTVFA